MPTVAAVQLLRAQVAVVPVVPGQRVRLVQQVHQAPAQQALAQLAEWLQVEPLVQVLQPVARPVRVPPQPQAWVAQVAQPPVEWPGQVAHPLVEWPGQVAHPLAEWPGQVAHPLAEWPELVAL